MRRLTIVLHLTWTNIIAGFHLGVAKWQWLPSRPLNVHNRVTARNIGTTYHNAFVEERQQHDSCDLRYNQVQEMIYSQQWITGLNVHQERTAGYHGLITGLISLCTYACKIKSLKLNNIRGNKCRGRARRRRRMADSSGENNPRAQKRFMTDPFFLFPLFLNHTGAFFFLFFFFFCGRVQDHRVMKNSNRVFCALASVTGLVFPGDGKAVRRGEGKGGSLSVTWPSRSPQK